MDDILIHGGQVLDGSGAPGRFADVIVTDGRIVAIDSGQGRQAHRSIDATGQVVAPGFIDIHTHPAFARQQIHRPKSKLPRGVTPKVLGNAASPPRPACQGPVRYCAITWLPAPPGWSFVKPPSLTI